MSPAPETQKPQVNGTGGKDKREAARMEAYTKHWAEDSAKDDASRTESRLASYANLVNGYYDGATILYEYGWGSSFHFCRYYKGEPFFQAIARHEHYLSAQIGLKPGMRVLDVGCGIGGPAREIARFSGCDIVGINNNGNQVDIANRYTAKAGMSDQVTFVKGDFMNLVSQFGENSFDAIYAIEATCHAPTWEGVYGEMKKVLKPGGVMGIYEWCMTDSYDKSIPAHKEVAHGIELGDGIAEMRTIKQARQALKTVGMEILVDEDLAERPDEIRWYYPLEGNLFKCQRLWDMVMVWRMTWIGKNMSQKALEGLEYLGLVPKGTGEVSQSLQVAQVALVKGGQKKLFTPMMLFVARKPEN